MSEKRPFFTENQDCLIARYKRGCNFIRRRIGSGYGNVQGLPMEIDLRPSLRGIRMISIWVSFMFERMMGRMLWF